ncbi:MAG: AAA family ATPase [Lachnospiraceae bacterium]|nr:AAA family ATPase [Lachnospiraceae bacterium]
MGVYLNPKNKGFWESTRSEIYVDKTGFIACTNKCLNTEQKYICVSRPRRFGKSMALKMLAAVLEQIYADTDKQFIFLIDEWDCVVRERQESDELQKNYLDFLRNLLKDRV